MVANIFTVKITKFLSRVSHLLHYHAHLRDDDRKLVANIWSQDCRKLGYDIDTLTAREFMQLLIDKKISNEQSIRRCRRKLQEEFPNLRGKKYTARQENQESVINQLNSTPEFYPGGTP